MDATPDRDMDDGGGRSGVQVIARAAAVLRALKDGQGGMSLGQIAQAVGLPRSTVQRIVQALQEERLVIASQQAGSLRLGPEVVALAAAAQISVVELCRPILTRIAEETGETADLSVLRGEGMIFLDQVPGSHRLRTVSSVGEVFPLTDTANGRAVLAALPEAQALRLIGAEWDRRALPGRPTDLIATMPSIRETGLAQDLDEHTEGISAIGFAFRDWAGDLHAISVPVPSSRFADQRAAVARALTAARQEIGRVLGL